MHRSLAFSMLFLALAAPTRAASSDPRSALASLRGGDVVRIQLASGATLQGAWAGAAGDSLRLAGVPALPLEGIRRLDVRRTSVPAYAILGGLVCGLLAASTFGPSGGDYYSTEWSWGAAAGGAVVGAGVGALLGRHRYRWSRLYPAPPPFESGLEAKKAG